MAVKVVDSKTGKTVTHVFGGPAAAAGKIASKKITKKQQKKNKKIKKDGPLKPMGDTRSTKSDVKRTPPMSTFKSPGTRSEQLLGGGKTPKMSMPAAGRLPDPKMPNTKSSNARINLADGGTVGKKQIPEGPKGKGLRALKAKAPEVAANMGYKHGGAVTVKTNQKPHMS
tara:strand:- start:2183 stop:2692 length:510 start_codon:yes stop_codon:yes gene_type:complete